MKRIGEIIDDYTLISKIGEGGMGLVYLAYENTSKRKVAIKALHPALSGDPLIRKRFAKEATLLSKLDHKNIVKHIKFLEDDDGIYIIMEYVQGLTLDELIKTKTGPIPEQRAFKILEGVLDGLQFAHMQTPSIIHRDIKPGNIIIDENNNAKLIDFGIVKLIESDNSSSLTKTGTQIGTPGFMSPEQILGSKLDTRTDVYSLGITLFVMLTGRSPYAENISQYELMKAIIDLTLPRAKNIYPFVSEKAQEIIDKATEKNVDDRFQSCSEFKKELQSAFYHQNRFDTKDATSDSQREAENSTTKKTEGSYENVKKTHFQQHKSRSGEVNPKKKPVGLNRILAKANFTHWLPGLLIASLFAGFLLFDSNCRRDYSKAVILPERKITRIVETALTKTFNRPSAKRTETIVAIR